MRLTKLKLAGFKSFVDPTNVLLPGQLVGVVGPNGCGKSNIIDAVRWVLGESKAAALRGESMQDVIFNGSTQRKPVGRASVELVFDNALGKAAGQWSQYAEVAVKRVLERDGESSYYLNNVHVRRRDVIDLFLGTGLGPRAYAIIEQGMISRIIEAKPEELRLFLEEAAGVTKYRERRRETESRLADARENLVRVEDIRNELEAQIFKLQGQAEIAGRYRALQAQLAETQNLLWLHKRNAARAERERLARDVDRAINRIEAETANLRDTEARLEQARSQHYAASDTLHSAQSDMYGANAEVARLESELQHLRDARQRLDARMAHLDDEQAQWEGRQQSGAAEQTRWGELLENARQRVAATEERHAELASHLPQAETALQQAQSAANDLRRELAQAEQQARVEETHRANAQRSLESLAQRRARVADEIRALQRPDDGALASTQAALAELETIAETRQEDLARLQRQLPEAEMAHRAAQDQEKAAQRRLTEARARRDALRQLQQRVQQNGNLGDWLRSRGLENAAPLWQSLQVEPGWETALESVLRERLSAVRAGDVAQIAAALANPAPVSFALTLGGAADAGSEAQADAHGAPAGVPLFNKLRIADPAWRGALREWLDGVLAVDDVADLVQRRGELPAGTLCVNRAGQTVSRHGVGLYAPDTRTHGVLERQHELESLDALIQASGGEAEAARMRVGEADEALAEHKEQLARVRQMTQEYQQRRHATQLDVLKLSQALQRYRERGDQLERDLAEIAQAEQAERDHLRRAEIEAGRQRELADSIAAMLEEASATQRDCEAKLREVRGMEQAAARDLQEARFSERECAAKLDEIDRTLAVAGDQLERIGAEFEAGREERAAVDETALAAQLQQALEERQRREAGLSESRNALEEAAASLRGLEEARLKTEQSLTPLRDRIGDLKLRQQAAQLNEEQFNARLAESFADEALLAPKLTADLREPALQAEIARLGEETAALGPVNLAALDELAAASERKGYLDSQSADLTQAIDTLEDAIRRIDRETRAQLQDTYNQVNSHFGTLFPQLFGGGEARLILTGDEILDSGIQVLAQPPGKKNSSIHLLSGGEKALTAIALVFSIFQLNPAPFCLLDEVDAPLDDTNTERFCDMVKRMSQQTQFLFISHNKITMEMAQQLVGVTMQESGVSRVVEVDIEEALKLSEEVAA